MLAQTLSSEGTQKSACLKSVLRNKFRASIPQLCFSTLTVVPLPSGYFMNALITDVFRSFSKGLLDVV